MEGTSCCGERTCNKSYFVGTCFEPVRVVIVREVKPCCSCDDGYKSGQSPQHPHGEEVHQHDGDYFAQNAVEYEGLLHSADGSHHVFAVSSNYNDVS